MREPRRFTIEELLSDHNQIIVPKYQRGYDWRFDKEIRDFFSDIFSCIDSEYNRDLFLGTMIFDVSKEKKEIKEIIDGQQRLTTILITLIACRNFSNNILKDNALAFRTQQMISKTNAINEIKDFGMIASNSIRDVFEEMCGGAWNGIFKDSIKTIRGKKSVKRQNARLKPIYDFIYLEIVNYCKGDPRKKFIGLLKQLYQFTYIIKIEIEDKEEAFEIFERTNARGKGLEISDLLKNFLFSKNKETELKNIEEKWTQITDNSENSMLRMLKYFWVSRKGYISRRDLYRNIRIYADDIGINDFVCELQEFSIFYNAYMSKERNSINDWLEEEGFEKNNMYLNEASRSISALKMFGVTQTIPLIFSSLKSYIKSECKDPKKFLTFLRFLESYHFINNKICNRIGNEVEKIYAKESEKFFNSKEFVSNSQKLIDSLSKETAKEKEFIANFSDISYENINDKKKIHYIFDKIANQDIKDGARNDLICYYNINKDIESSFNIDHLLCQKIGNEDEENSMYINEIGNLIVIAKQINGIFGKADFETKIKMILNPEKYDNKIRNIPGYLREFAYKNKDKKTWNKDNILKRTEFLAKETYKILSQEYKYK